MEQLLANPAVQAGVAPFVAALLVSVPLRRTRCLKVAIGVGFAVVVALTVGFSFESLTSMRKLVLMGLGVAFLALAVDATQLPSRPVEPYSE